METGVNVEKTVCLQKIWGVDLAINAKVSVWGNRLQLPSTKLVWFGGYPAHYMGEFHKRLEDRHSDLFFVYAPLSAHGPAFSHERTSLPIKHVLLSRANQFVQAWWWLNRLNPCAVLVTGNFPRVNLVAALWAILKRRKLYYLADTNLLDQRNRSRGRVRGLILRMTLRRATMLLSIGTRNSEFYLFECGKENVGNKLHAMPLPHLNSPFEAVKENVSDLFTFMVFGRLDPIKAVDRVIDAYAQLSFEERQHSRLLIVGDGLIRSELEAQTSVLGVDAHVEFRGAVPSHQAPQVFGEANALIVASHDEPWGLVVNEALSAGKPVIGPFWIGSFADLIIHGKTGLVTYGNSPEQLVAAMRVLLNDPNASKTMGLAGREYVNEQGWTIEGSLKAFASLLAMLDK